MERLQIIKLSCGGVAEAAGLMVGDWLDEYNGVLLVSSESLSAAIKKSSGTHTPIMSTASTICAITWCIVVKSVYNVV